MKNFIRAIILSATIVASTGANAFELVPKTVGLHLVSHHFKKAPPGQPGFNNNNYGLYVKWDNGLTAGTLVNSIDRRGNYVGWTFEHAVTERFSVALTAGAIGGYDKMVQDNYTGAPSEGYHVNIRCNSADYCRPVLLKSIIAPLVVPSISYAFTKHASARLSWIVKTHTDSAHAAHLSAEWNF